MKLKYGNALKALNNLIFICEIIECKSVLVENNIWNIKNQIKYEKYNITIDPVNFIDCFNDINIICLKRKFVYGFLYIIRKTFRNVKFSNIDRREVIRKGIEKDTPNINTSPQDLYIHIRSGDIFTNNTNKLYTQPPLCFYQKIINNYEFKKIFILSNGKENPCVNKLLELYPKIEYIQSSIINDSTLLFNAYNLVGGRSTFIWGIIYFSKKLRNLWTYNRIIKSHNKRYTNFYMKASAKYKKIMFPWKNTSIQYSLMINDTCSGKKFKIIN